ncbi:MAG: hypothetical protein QT04_C0043G0002 [archaeon GW2011_AR11]|nr:MAG: hypothetical protein QT04_C0043G0002 [archaeon GW2011_AR11]
MRIKRPDKKNALSIVAAAERDMNFTLSLPLTEDSTATIARNIYESFRMLGDALLVAKGIESKDHILPIKEIMKLDIETARPLGVLDNFRRLRHNINYYGYKPRIEEVADAVDYAKKCFGLNRLASTHEE